MNTTFRLSRVRSSLAKRIALGATFAALALPLSGHANSGVALDTKTGAWWVISDNRAAAALKSLAVSRHWTHFRINADKADGMAPKPGFGWGAVAVNPRKRKIWVVGGYSTEALAKAAALKLVGAGGEIRFSWRDWNDSRRATDNGQGRSY